MLEETVDKSLAYTIALSHCDAIGPVQYRRLIGALGTVERGWNAETAELRAAGFADGFIQCFSETRRRIPDPTAALERMRSSGVNAICANDPQYPAQLLDLHDAPFILFYRGALPWADEQLVAVVGTRRCSSYGVHATKTIGMEIANDGCAIVSGLALGIDAFSHRAALDARARTIAVLGGGVDRDTIGPRQNLQLAEEIIASGGCVLSEYPPGSQPTRTHFPMRNRIVAGLSAGVLVVEAPFKSGALITADIALNLGRDVFAVPGNITSPLSAGANFLIQNGAHIALSGRDVTETLHFNTAVTHTKKASRVAQTSTPVEDRIGAVLAVQSLHSEAIARECNLDIATVNGTLLLMEMKGKVAHLGGMMYKKA